MPPSILEKDLINYRTQQDRLLDKESQRVIEELERAYADFFRDVEEGLAEIPTNADGSMNTKAAVLFAAGIGGLGLRRLQPVIDRFEEGFLPITRGALSYFPIIGKRFTPSELDAEQLDIGVDLAIEELIGLFNSRAVEPLITVVIGAAQGNRPHREVVKEVKNIISEGNILRKDGKKFTSSNIEVMVGDTYARHQRKVRAEASEALGLDFVHYVGPLDEKTRNSCQFLLTGSDLGREDVWRLEDFTSDLHPDLGAPPLLAGGGPNCRHEPLQISAEEAKELGAIQ